MDDLLLFSGNDIPFIEAQINIHQPIIKQIAYIGQDNFYNGCQLLTFSKQLLKVKDKNSLKDYNDFDILMTMIKDNNVNKQCKQNMFLLLLLLFPQHKINFLPNSIMLSKQGQNNHLIDKDNFNNFREILEKMFCLKHLNKNKYNPGGPQAKALVQKFEKRQKKLNELKGNKNKQKTSMFSQCVSILSVGLGKDVNELLHYTVFQLLYEFRRFKMKQQYDLYVSAKMAGAKNLEEIENWIDTIYPDTL